MIEKVYTGDLYLEMIQDNVDNSLIALQNQIDTLSTAAGVFSEVTIVNIEVDGTNAQTIAHPYGENAKAWVGNQSTAASWTIVQGNNSLQVVGSAAATATLFIIPDPDNV